MTGGEQGGVSWRDGIIPVSVRFDDPYFSFADGLAETRHVFLAGNALPARFAPGFRIAELGFGTGLNLMATLLEWRASGVPGPLHFTSFEAYPLDAATMARALDAFPEARAIADPILSQWASGPAIRLPDLHADIVIGDARGTLPAWRGMADAWFLDGFSPARNPDMWSPALMGEVARHTAPGGTFATYTAAGHVRRALTDAGFTAARRPGHARKRHMTAGVKT